MTDELPTSNTELKPDHATLVAQLKEKGVDDIEIKHMIHDWKVQKLDEGVSRAEMIVKLGEMCEEAGLIKEALHQYNKEISSHITRLNSLQG